MKNAIPFILLLALAVKAHATVDVQLPLQGYYHPGRYMPVTVRATGESPAWVTLKADGAVPTVVASPPVGVDVTVPWLVVRQGATRLTSAVGADERPVEVELRALDESKQRLVAVYDASAVDFAKTLFPGREVIALTNPPGLLAGPAAAWEALDGAVLDRMPPPERVAALLAAGTTLAVRESDAPRDNWPWQLVGDYWVLRPAIVGPRGATAGGAYDPPQMWDPGRPPAARRQAVLLGVVFALLAVGVSLWRSRLMIVAMLGLCAVSTLAALAWRRQLSPIIEANGGVIVTSDDFTQRDDWIYRRHLEPTPGSIAGAGLLKPVFASAAQIARTSIRLDVAGRDDASLRFSYRLEPGWTLAFLTRRAAPARWPGAPTTPVNSPLREIAPLYLVPGLTLAGELPDQLPSGESPPAGVDRWPAVVIERSSAGTTAPPR